MKVGIPKEIKNNENRVGMTPAGVAELARRGHDLRFGTALFFLCSQKSKLKCRTKNFWNYGWIVYYHRCYRCCR